MSYEQKPHKRSTKKIDDPERNKSKEEEPK